MNVKFFAETIEDAAYDQVMALANHPAFKDCKIRIMPDVHAGAGCVVGFTADLGEKVIPNIVGVDIGCGMLTFELGQIDIDFEKLDNVIRNYVPNGREVHLKPIYDIKFLERLYCYDYLKNIDWLLCSLGTLGGGNHFIEVDEDDCGNKFLVIHTGSRNLGKQVADYYQKVAIDNFSGVNELQQLRQKLINSLKEQGREKEISGALKELNEKFQLKNAEVSKELCYLEGEDRVNYLHDMQLCQDFAVANRFHIGYIIAKHMDWEVKDCFETIHNYIELGTNMVRKGAISAAAGQRVLIPMNMRDGCIIGIGKGNDDWNCSAPHGAGRLMSRKKAKELISMEEYSFSMEGIYTTSVNELTVDEAPMAYKSAEEIERLVADTIDIERIIKPIYNFKSSN